MTAVGAITGQGGPCRSVLARILARTRRQANRRHTKTTPAARRQAHLETLDTIANQVDEFELAIAGMANDPAMDVGGAPELLGRAGNRLGGRQRDAAQGAT